MLLICNDCAKKSLLELRPLILRSVVLLILPRGHILRRPLNVNLGGSILAYVDSFKYLGSYYSG